MALSLVVAVLCLSLLQLSNGQPEPTRPVLSESFTTKLLQWTRMHAGQETKESYMRYRDFREGLGIDRQMDMFGAEAESHNIVLDAKEGMMYDYFDEPNGNCSSTSAPLLRLIPQWAFVARAKYKGAKKFKKTEVDIWFHNNTKVNLYIELGVLKNNPNVPVFYFLDNLPGTSLTTTTLITFEDYTEGAPNPSKFKIPSICKTKPTWFHHDTPARNYNRISVLKRLNPMNH